jgi:hypothetical protein
MSRKTSKGSRTPPEYNNGYGEYEHTNKIEQEDYSDDSDNDIDSEDETLLKKKIKNKNIPDA